MTRRSIGATLLLIGMLFIASCGIGPSSLSQQQLQEFIQQRHIQPLAVKDLGGDMTVILYKNDREMGCYVAFTGNGIEALQLKDELLNLKMDAIKPISFAYKSIVIKYDVICLTINNEDIRSKARTIKVVSSENEDINIPIENNGNMIIYQKAEVDSSRITIIVYDGNQKEIARVPF